MGMNLYGRLLAPVFTRVYGRHHPQFAHNDGAEAIMGRRLVRTYDFQGKKLYSLYSHLALVIWRVGVLGYAFAKASKCCNLGLPKKTVVTHHSCIFKS
jgi:hypothetical protein